MILKKTRISETQSIKDEFESSTGKKFKSITASIETDTLGNIIEFDTDDVTLQDIVKSKGAK